MSITQSDILTFFIKCVNVILRIIFNIKNIFKDDVVQMTKNKLLDLIKIIKVIYLSSFFSNDSEKNIVKILFNDDSFIIYLQSYSGGYSKILKFISLDYNDITFFNMGINDNKLFTSFFIENEYLIIQTGDKILFYDFYMIGNKKLQYREGVVFLKEISDIDMKDVILDPDKLQTNITEVIEVRYLPTEHFSITFSNNKIQTLSIKDVFNNKDVNLQ